MGVKIRKIGVKIRKIGDVFYVGDGEKFLVVMSEKFAKYLAKNWERASKGEIEFEW